jgi:transcriptional regulator with XRE-family HTH domain
MDDAPTTTSRHLSRNLLELRRSRNLSQTDLGSLAGLARTTVTHIESGSGNPSLHNLIRLAGALRVSIDELLAGPRKEVLLVRSADLPCITKSDGASRIADLLGDRIAGISLERVEIGAGTQLVGAPHVRNSREYIAILNGRAEICLAEESHRLRKGDVLSFPGDQHHVYRNIGSRKLSFLSVVAVVPSGS